MPDVVDLIISDHRELQRLFDELRTDRDKRANLAPVMTNLLYAHSRAEEQEVYPAARDAGGEDDVEHSQREHLEADQLAEKLCGLDPLGDEFDDTLGQLIDAVTHHIGEEEESVLPHMRDRMKDQRLQELADRFLGARAQHLGDQPTDITKQDLQQQAANIGENTQGSKEELKSELADEAET